MKLGRPRLNRIEKALAALNPGTKVRLCYAARPGARLPVSAVNVEGIATAAPPMGARRQGPGPCCHKLRFARVVCLEKCVLVRVDWNDAYKSDDPEAKAAKLKAADVFLTRYGRASDPSPFMPFRFSAVRSCEVVTGHEPEPPTRLHA